MRLFVQLGRQFYLRMRGVSQGSVLSTIHCNCYYGAMEREHMTCGSDELLMRQVDDFLFVTPHHARARSFLQLVLKGKLSQRSCIPVMYPGMSLDNRLKCMYVLTGIR